METLARQAALEDFYRGDHNPFGFGRFNLASGTALMARRELRDPISHPFAGSWRDTKGFVAATIAVPEWGREIDVVSVHLDFLAPGVRRRQIRRMGELLAGRGRPLVVLGDLNCCRRYDPRSLDLLEEVLGVEAHEPEAGSPTFPAFRPARRIDWIFTSPELSFVLLRDRRRAPLRPPGVGGGPGPGGLRSGGAPFRLKPANLSRSWHGGRAPGTAEPAPW